MLGEETEGKRPDCDSVGIEHVKLFQRCWL
jgi:hypothetical protein